MGSEYNKKNCMILMAISRHMQALLTFSGLASILIQKTTMSFVCLNCGTLPFHAPLLLSQVLSVQRWLYYGLHYSFTMYSIFATICLLYHSCLVLCVLTNLFSLFAF